MDKIRANKVILATKSSFFGILLYRPDQGPGPQLQEDLLGSKLVGFLYLLVLLYFYYEYITSYGGFCLACLIVMASRILLGWEVGWERVGGGV